MAADPTDLLAAANQLDLASYVEHSTGCPDWYRAHQIDHAATRDRRCDCGLAEQLAAAEMLATFVRELLGQADPGRWAWLDGKSIHIEGAYAVNPTAALRLAADLIRATAEAGKGGE